MTSVRPVVDAIIAELLVRHRASGRVHLNDITEVIGTRAITADEVELIVDRLEAEGLRVGEALDETDIALVHAVLTSARKLAAAHGRKPTVAEIARDIERPDHDVRRALEHAARK